MFCTDQVNEFFLPTFSGGFGIHGCLAPEREETNWTTLDISARVSIKCKTHSKFILCFHTALLRLS